MAGLVAADVSINGQPLTTLASANPALLTSTLSQCETALGLEVLKSEAISAPAAAKIAECDAQAATASCQQQIAAAVLQGP